MCLLWAVTFSHTATCQEHQGPLLVNAALRNHSLPLTRSKTTAIPLPFFEDFTGYDVYPDPAKWVDRQVYINNTFCINPIARGVATFDALNEKGLPWYPYSNIVHNLCDSLTSQPFDFSFLNPSDSLYLSYFVQPQGYGYFPASRDSLLLLFRLRSGEWRTVWRGQGTSITTFTQIMVPIVDSNYFFEGFQFRFINIAAMNYADAHWHLDYIRLDANRRFDDTAINDVAISKNPGFLLNDYTAMPYRQFYANPSGERAAIIIDSVRNTNASLQPITYGFEATELNTGTTLQPTVLNTNIVNAYSTAAIVNNTYTTTITPTGAYDKVVFTHKHYIEATTATGSVDNDTIIKEQVFDNYLAYDDGSAEQSYYLTLFPTLPGKIAIEYHLNTPDTLKGLAIYFGRQAPPSIFKTFDINIYSTLQGIDGAAADNVLYRQPSCDPGYVDTINHFWIYKFDTPLPLPAGRFYGSVFMPAESGADSLYFGLDMNRIGGNHAYYNVLAAWSPSLIQGAIMMRPLLGQDVISTGIRNTQTPVQPAWSVWPNPATDAIRLSFPTDNKLHYRVYGITGQTVKEGYANSGAAIEITDLIAGAYYVTIHDGSAQLQPIKIIKL